MTGRRWITPRKAVELTELGEQIEAARIKRGHSVEDVARLVKCARSTLNRARIRRYQQEHGPVGEDIEDRLLEYIRGEEDRYTQSFSIKMAPEGLTYPALLWSGWALRKPVDRCGYPCPCNLSEDCSKAISNGCLAFCERITEEEILKPEELNYGDLQWQGPGVQSPTKTKGN